MKKIALFSLMCCLCGVYAVPALAADTCGTTILHLDWNQDPNDDEFLYVNRQAQTQAQKDYDAKGNDKKNMTDGQYNLKPKSLVFECDKDQCPTRTVVYVPNDKGIVENTTGGYFRCVAIFGKNDYWFKVPECNDGEKIEDFNEYIYSVESDIVVNKVKPKNLFKSVSKQACICGSTKEVVVEEGKKVCRTKGTVTPPRPVTGGCLEIDGTTRIAKGKVSVHQVCQVKALSDAGAEQCVCQCVDNNKWRCDVTSCKGDSYGRNYNWVENETNVSGGKGVCKEAKKGTPVTKSCKDSRKTQTGKACCDVPKTQATYDEKTDKCNCLVPNAVFDIIQGKGQCVVKETEPIPVTPVEKCKYVFNATIECNGVSKTIKKEKILTESELGGKECNDFQQLYSGDVEMAKKLFGDLCAAGQSTVTVPERPVENGPTQNQIRSAQNVLNAFTVRAEKERSVWKTAEGNFNGARLASDITAGVVLGTVGGVVTGNIIKKNQVKKGFEALHCTVGGQKVADWGDEFSVGLHR